MLRLQIPILRFSLKVMKTCINVLLVACVLTSSGVAGDEDSVTDEVVRQRTAVALNYCRAALHRIRRNPEKRIFLEEQQRILSNLDLNQIADAEVIDLYQAVLDEIGQVVISERERAVIDEQFRSSTHRQLGTSFFVIGAQVATGQVGSAIESGANSWWDYRNREGHRDSDQWKVDRSEFSSLMSRSSTFLDSFWKLSRRNNIPDRWLVRDYDLDQLAKVLREPDGTRRLRMLKRLDRFMECYPPYYYYLARTQQQLGHLDDAMETYQKLSAIGGGHFRQDDMMASSFANMALIQEMHGDPAAAQTALRSGDFSTRNWEANLVCAWVLGRHQQHRDAEDLILCNLDDRLESAQSRIALVSLYYHGHDAPRLATLLEDEQIVRAVPIPGLLLCARMLGDDGLPRVAANRLASSLSAEWHPGGRTAVVVLRASDSWKLQDAQPHLEVAGHEAQSVEYRHRSGELQAEFQVAAADMPTGAELVGLTLSYPGTPPIRVVLSARNESNPAVGGFGTHRLVPRARVALGIDEIVVDGVRLSLHGADDDNSVRGAAGEPEEERVRS